MKRDRKALGIPLNERLAAHAGGDDRLGTLVGRYRGAAASTITAKPVTAPKRAAAAPKLPKTRPKKALGREVRRSGDVFQASPMQNRGW